MSGTIERIERRIRDRREGVARYAPILFVAACGGIFALVAVKGQTPTDYQCFDNCFGVVKVEGHNAFEFVNIKTKIHREMRFCPQPTVNLFAGYVVKKIVILEGPCQDLDRSDLYYDIVRGKDKQWAAVYGDLTYYDGDDRPVLAKNCRNTPDDQDTICDGGGAQFERELSQK